MEDSDLLRDGWGDTLVFFIFVQTWSKTTSFWPGHLKKFPGPKRRRFAQAVLKKKRRRAPSSSTCRSSSSSFTHSVEQVVCTSKRSHHQLQEVADGAPRLFPWLPRGRVTPLTPLWLRHPVADRNWLKYEQIFCDKTYRETYWPKNKGTGNTNFPYLTTKS